MRRSYRYQSRENRDRHAADLRAAGYRVRKSSSRNVCLSPDYVADYSGTPTPNGFGGNAPTYFARVYTVEVI